MSDRPNIIFILADDMGYGDVRHLNPDCCFPTPNLDRLGREGMHFTDAHSSSSVCTPSRYSIMTGRYCWRTWLKQGVLGGVAGPLIEEGRDTVASLLGRAGYRTACIGKWHLGWDWAVAAGHEAQRGQWTGAMDWIDYSRPVRGGPIDRGFDYFYGISGSLDMPPYVYVEDDRPVATPTAWGSEAEFGRAGPRQEGLRADHVLAHCTARAVDYIAAAPRTEPFFLYLPLTAPHTPIAPAAPFAGRSGVNAYADFCIEVDHRVGEVLAALDAAGIAEDTLVVFTTDNGASRVPSGCEELEREHGHHSSHIYRGYKSDIWDGGHRLPFLARWPAAVAPGSRCDQPVGLFDLYATAADLLGVSIAPGQGEDSLSLLPALRGGRIDAAARTLIHHSLYGRFAVRRGDWKLCRCPGSGGWSHPTDQEATDAAEDSVQLYDLAAEPGETSNRAADEPDRVRELTAELHRCVARGSSVAGRTGRPTAVADWPQVDWLPEIPERFLIDD